MNRFFKLISAVIYPRRCLICDRVLPYPETVCASCAELTLHYGGERGAVCGVCGLPLKKCNCGPNRLYEKAVFPLFYEGPVRSALHRFKFRGRLDKTEPFALALLTALKERGVWDRTDLICPVPMDKKAQKRRGYNQSEELCNALTKRTGKPMAALLYKFCSNDTQHDVPGLLYRSGNVLGVYEPAPETAALIPGKRILLVDDILTTGSTLNEAAKTLLIFGAESVYAAAVAAVPKR